MESCCESDLTGGCHFSNLRHVCGDSFHALQCLRVSGVEMKFMGDHCKLSFSHLPPAFASAFHNIPKWRACSQAKYISIPFIHTSHLLHISPYTFDLCIYIARAEDFLFDFGFYFFKASLEPYALCCKQNK